MGEVIGGVFGEDARPVELSVSTECARCGTCWSCSASLMLRDFGAPVYFACPRCGVLEEHHWVVTEDVAASTVDEEWTSVTGVHTELVRIVFDPCGAG